MPDFLTVDAFIRPTRGRIRRMGGPASAMTHALQARTHRVGVFLQARPLASTGARGLEKPPSPQLPEADRAGC